MPRTRPWSAESRNPGKSWDTLEPLPAPALSPGEVRRKRIELAEEMLGDFSKRTSLFRVWVPD
jgi:hypothetical protein